MACPLAPSSVRKFFWWLAQALATAASSFFQVRFGALITKPLPPAARNAAAGSAADPLADRGEWIDLGGYRTRFVEASGATLPADKAAQLRVVMVERGEIERMGADDKDVVRSAGLSLNPFDNIGDNAGAALGVDHYRDGGLRHLSGPLRSCKSRRKETSRVSSARTGPCTTWLRQYCLGEGDIDAARTAEISLSALVSSETTGCRLLAPEMSG